MLTDEAPDCDGQGQGQTIRANRRLSEVLATRRAGAQGRRVVVVVVDVEKKNEKKTNDGTERSDRSVRADVLLLGCDWTQKEEPFALGQ